MSLYDKDKFKISEELYSSVASYIEENLVQIEETFSDSFVLESSSYSDSDIEFIEKKRTTKEPDPLTQSKIAVAFPGTLLYFSKE